MADSEACLQWSLHALLSPLRCLDSRAAGACWFALREGWLRDHPAAADALRDACNLSRLQPCQQLLSWARRAKDVGTTNCIRPKAALATVTVTEQWSPARREANVTQRVGSVVSVVVPQLTTLASWGWLPGSWLRYSLGTRSQAAQNPKGGCGLVARPGRSRSQLKLQTPRLRVPPCWRAVVWWRCWTSYMTASRRRQAPSTPPPPPVCSDGSARFLAPTRGRPR